MAPSLSWPRPRYRVHAEAEHPLDPAALDQPDGTSARAGRRPQRRRHKACALRGRSVPRSDQRCRLCRAATFQPVLVLEGGSQVHSGIALDWLRDRAGNRTFPSSVDLTRDPKVADVPQPGQVVALDLHTGKTTTVAAPSTSIQRVRFAHSDTVVVVGFMHKHLVVYSNHTADGVWLLVWNTTTGTYGRTLLLEGNPAVPPVISRGLNFTVMLIPTRRVTPNVQHTGYP